MYRTIEVTVESETFFDQDLPGSIFRHLMVLYSMFESTMRTETVLVKTLSCVLKYVRPSTFD